MEAITKIKRFRRLPDESTSILPDVIDGIVEDEPEDKYYQITTDPSSMSYGMLTALNYKEIYSQIIEKVLQFYLMILCGISIFRHDISGMISDHDVINQLYISISLC